MIALEGRKTLAVFRNILSRFKSDDNLKVLATQLCAPYTFRQVLPAITKG